MEFLDAYVDMCRTLGPLVDWVQGAGGNISFKNEKELLIKASGFVLGATTHTTGWVRCDLAKVQQAFQDSNDNLTGAVLEGTGKPSIETFLHCLPSRIVVHLHPMNLLPQLCDDDDSLSEFPTISYMKPGLELGRQLLSIYTPDAPIYLLQNHGIVITGDTCDSIFASLQTLQSKIPAHIPQSDVEFVWKLRRALPDLLIRPIIQVHPSLFHSRVFLPYTPDIVVFLQQAPLFYDELTAHPEKALKKYVETYGCDPTIIYTPTMIYCVAPTLQKCVAIEEIFCAYLRTPSTRSAKFLTAEQISELVNWDKEKERKSAR